VAGHILADREESRLEGSHDAHKEEEEVHCSDLEALDHDLRKREQKANDEVRRFHYATITVLQDGILHAETYRHDDHRRGIRQEGTHEAEEARAHLYRNHGIHHHLCSLCCDSEVTK